MLDRRVVVSRKCTMPEQSHSSRVRLERSRAATLGAPQGEATSGDWISPHIPGWPERGRFSKDDRAKIAVMVAPLPRLVEDIVGGLHFASGVPRPWERGRLRAYAYDALAFALDYFRWEVRPQSAPIFRVSHALLREREFDLPQKPDSARRGLEKIISEVRREQ